MAQATTMRTNRLAWVDLSSSDAAASRDFYAKLFGWSVEVSDDPQYGGYALAKVDGQDVAGIGPTQSPEQPTTWALYIGTDDAAALGSKVEAAGGSVLMGAFDVGDQGRMAVFKDPSGAIISGWQPGAMGTFRAGDANTLGWAELSARGIDKAVAFYQAVFGWTDETSPMGEGQSDYHTFSSNGDPVAGGMEMSPGIPDQVPSYWMPYFNVDDVDAAYQRALDLGAREMVSPSDFPGGRFAIISDPQGAALGLLKQ